MKQLHLREIFGYIVAVIVSLCCVCSVAFIGISMFDGSSISTPAPVQVFDTPLPIPTIISLTFSSAGTQTALANPPPLVTITLAPTATIRIFDIQTNAANPTEYVYSTNTPFSLETPTLQAALPSQTAVCSCSIDYNCPDFSSHDEAQACFEYCKSKGYGDVHGLDRDDDNLACEETNYQ